MQHDENPRRSDGAADRPLPGEPAAPAEPPHEQSRPADPPPPEDPSLQGDPSEAATPAPGGRLREGEDPEPPYDPDSRQRLSEEIPDAPHPPSRYDAGTGQGTATNPPRGDDTQDRPILDGSTQTPVAEASVPNPYRGETDPALVSHQPALNSTRTDRWLYASIVAAVVVVVALLLLARWNPVWCGVGVVAALVAVLLMLVVRASGLGRRARLRLDALLMAVLWLVPLGIILWTIIGFADEIWVG